MNGVLIVDGSPHRRQRLVDMFRTKKLCVHHAGDATEARNAARASAPTVLVADMEPDTIALLDWWCRELPKSWSIVLCDELVGAIRAACYRTNTAWVVRPFDAERLADRVGLLYQLNPREWPYVDLLAPTPRQLLAMDDDCAEWRVIAVLRETVARYQLSTRQAQVLVLTTFHVPRADGSRRLGINAKTWDRHAAQIRERVGMGTQELAMVVWGEAAGHRLGYDRFGQVLGSGVHYIGGRLLGGRGTGSN